MLNIIIIFSIIGGIDKLLGNKYNLGERFEEGFKSIGSLGLTIIGIYILSPIVAEKITLILNPILKIIKIDPSLIISSLLAPDLGGYNTSVNIANSKLIGEFNGVILSSTLGTLISFTIPIAVGLVGKQDFNYFAKGVLIGIMTIPIGNIVGGIIIDLNIVDIIKNTIPVVIFSLIIILGLTKVQNKTIKFFIILGKGVLIISTLGLVLGIIKFIFNIKIMENMLPIEEGVILVFNIGIILSGAYPMFHLISKLLNKYLISLGEKVDMNEYAILGLISSLANCVPMLGFYDKMNDKGKIVNSAFAVSGAFVFGGQLAFISSVSPNMINPFIVSKLVSGFLAIIVASKVF